MALGEVGLRSRAFFSGTRPRGRVWGPQKRPAAMEERRASCGLPGGGGGSLGRPRRGFKVKPPFAGRERGERREAGPGSAPPTFPLGGPGLGARRRRSSSLCGACAERPSARLPPDRYGVCV